MHRDPVWGFFDARRWSAPLADWSFCPVRFAAVMTIAFSKPPHRYAETRPDATATGAPMTPRSDIFISYSSRDVDVANHIVAVLESAGLSCWIAHRDIASGTDYPTAIAEAIEGSRMVVLVFSQSANDSAEVNREIQFANEQRMPVLPVRIDNSSPTGSMRYKLGGTHWYDIDANTNGAALQGLPEKAFAALDRRPADRMALLRTGDGGGRTQRVNPVLVGALGIGAVVAVFVGAVAVTSGGGDETLVGTPYGWDDLRVGHCIEGLDFTQDPVVVPCTEPHRGEVVLAEDRFFAEAASMPTEDEFNERIGNACYDALVLYSELAYDNSAYEYRPHIPTASKWADGDRSLICVGSIPGEYEIRHSMRGN